MVPFLPYQHVLVIGVRRSLTHLSCVPTICWAHAKHSCYHGEQGEHHPCPWQLTLHPDGTSLCKDNCENFARVWVGGVSRGGAGDGGNAGMQEWRGDRSYGQLCCSALFFFHFSSLVSCFPLGRESFHPCGQGIKPKCLPSATQFFLSSGTLNFEPSDAKKI